jgi:uncharacterized membrane protein YeaQ/YmgE (transglycosylase-associated protein family)
MVGAIAGVVARRISADPEPGRFVVTIIVGIAGASLGGLVFEVLGGTGATGFDVRSVPAATLGAVVLLCLYGLIVRMSG